MPKIQAIIMRNQLRKVCDAIYDDPDGDLRVADLIESAIRLLHDH